MNMRRLGFGTLAAAAAATLFTLASLAGRAADEKPVFRAGAATANITPPLGEEIVGNFTTPPATHIHDELHARCLVLDDGKTKLAIVLCDNVGITREVHDAAKKIIAERNGIPPTHVLAAATHTHSGTSARSNDRLRANDPMTAYQDFVARRIADGVQTALNNLAPAKIGWGAVDVPDQVFNRRWLLKPGKTAKDPWGRQERAQMNPGRNPDILEPAGPTDPQVSFLAVETPDGKPVALLANYSLHYVGGVPSGHISADYFACFANKIGELLGADSRAFPPFVGIMSNGTSGDVNNINFKSDAPRPSHPPYEKMNLVANQVAEAVAGAYRDVKFQDYVTLDAEYRELPLATRKPTQEQIDYAQKVLADPEALKKLSVRDQSYARRTISIQKSPDEIKAPLQTLRIGDLGIATAPFEVFAEAGLEIKELSPFKPTFTIELANASYGYLPTPRHFEIGGYETWLGTNNVEPEASPKMIKNLMEMFAELKARQGSESAGASK